MHAGFQAHGYRVISVGKVSDRSKLMEATFPSIATLMSLEEAIVHELLIKLNLASRQAYCGTSRVSTNRNGLERFLTYHQLEIEVTIFDIKKRKISFCGWAHGNLHHIP